MNDSLDDIIAEAKAKRRKAEGLEAAQALDEQGLLPKHASNDESAFAKSAVEIAKAQHNAKEENVQQTHSNIKESIIAPIIEIALIQEAATKENEQFKKLKSVDSLTQLENDIIVNEIGEAHKDILQLLVSLEARGRDDAREDLRSLVSGEQMRLAAEMGNIAKEENVGLLRKLKRALV